MTADTIGGDGDGRVADKVLKIAAGHGARDMDEGGIVAEAHDVVVIDERHGKLNALLTGELCAMEVGRAARLTK